MESDGRIRSKDIGTGEVNSRTLDNIRSSNFDGSHTNPEEDPGTQGWQILKSGFVVINDAIVRGTIAAARIISAVLESGALNIRSGGSITVGGDPDTGVAALVTIDESGVAVGTDVVVDATGLHVIGGDVTPLWHDTQDDFTEGAALTTTPTVFNSVTFSPPSWVQTLHVRIALFFQITENGAAHLGGTYLNGETAATSGLSIAVETSGVGTNAASRVIHRSYTSFPVTIEQVSLVAAGTNDINRLAISAQAVGVRD